MKKVFRVIGDFQVLYLNQFQRSLVHVYRAAQFCGTTLDLDHHSVQLAWSVKSPGYILDSLLMIKYKTWLSSEKGKNHSFVLLCVFFHREKI